VTPKRKASVPQVTRSAEPLYQEIRAVLESARAGAYRAVNAAMVQAYWQVGRLIVEHEQKGRRRAGYGEAVIATLAERLTRDLGRGFDERNLWYMRSFHLAFPILNALRSESHPPTSDDAWCNAHARPEGDNPTIGLILCSKKNEAIAKYSVLSEARQIFAAKYVKILPTERELMHEIQRERRLIDAHPGTKSAAAKDDKST
jgi:hypothetical protein